MSDTEVYLALPDSNENKNHEKDENISIELSLDDEPKTKGEQKENIIVELSMPKKGKPGRRKKKKKEDDDDDDDEFAPEKESSEDDDEEVEPEVKKTPLSINHGQNVVSTPNLPIQNVQPATDAQGRPKIPHIVRPITNPQYFQQLNQYHAYLYNQGILNNMAVASSANAVGARPPLVSGRPTNPLANSIYRAPANFQATASAPNFYYPPIMIQPPPLQHPLLLPRPGMARPMMYPMTMKVRRREDIPPYGLDAKDIEQAYFEDTETDDNGRRGRRAQMKLKRRRGDDESEEEEEESEEEEEDTYDSEDEEESSTYSAYSDEDEYPRRKKNKKKSRSSGGSTPRKQSSPKMNPELAPVRFSARSRKVKSYAEDEYDKSLEIATNSKGSEAGESENELENENELNDADVENVDLVLDARPAPEEVENIKTDCEFLIKWKGLSHIHNTWDTYEYLQGCKGIRKVDNFIKKLEAEKEELADLPPEDIEQYNINKELFRQQISEYKIVERVIAQRDAVVYEEVEENAEEANPEEPKADENAEAEPKPPKEINTVEYLCKWKGLPYCDCTWELLDSIGSDFQNEIDAYLDRNQNVCVPAKNVPIGRQRPAFQKIQSQPSYLVGGELRDYQLDGLNWLVFSWCHYNNVILADEMGLGKTIQTISFLSYLHHSLQIYGPFLVVVPLSTIGSWQKEFNQWAPDMNVVCYTDQQKSRDIIRDYEIYIENSNKFKFNVLLTTPQFVVKDREFLSSIKWMSLCVDEAHRLKNSESQLHDSLKDFTTAHRLLITGTPLQNSVRELWALLNFLMPQKFSSVEHFESQYSTIEQESQIQKLHEELKPHLLRRVKKDVEKSLPGKSERILRIDISPLQKQYYRWILTKNYKALNKGVKGKQSTLLNIVNELKKAANHPFLFDSAVSVFGDYDDEKPYTLDDLVKNSGKMVLLDKLLPRLQANGHRVLIFSQMVKILDLLAEYLKLKGYSFQRLDGSTSSENRKKSIERFNAPNSPDFCFLLSTRAGGLGINLETADTVIIFDSDWNPQNDLQAMARAHRIGQKKTVNIYRFVSKGTVEEDILERAKKKMVLDHLIIQRMDRTGSSESLKNNLIAGGTASLISKPATNFSNDELTAILQFGAQALFSNTENAKLDEFDLDEILARAESHDTEKQQEQENSTNTDFLNQFKVADFGSILNWDDIIPEEERKRVEMEEKEKEQESIMYGYSRRRTTTNTFVDDGVKKKKNKGNTFSSRKRSTKNSALLNAEDLETSDLKALIKSVMKFGDIENRLNDILKDCDLENVEPSSITELCVRLISSCESAVQNEGDTKKTPKRKKAETAADDEVKTKNKPITISFEKVTNVNASIVVQRVQDMIYLNKMFRGLKNIMQFRFTSPLKPVYKWSVNWGQKEDAMLIIGIYKHGYGDWLAIKHDKSLNLQKKIFVEEDDDDEDGEVDRTANVAVGDGVPSATHLIRRVDYLMKVLKEEEGKKKKGSGTPGRKKKVESEDVEEDDDNDQDYQKQDEGKKKRGTPGRKRKVQKDEYEEDDNDDDYQN